MVVYAVLGTSRPLSVSTTTTIGILTGSQLALVAPGAGPTELLTASATLAFLVGIVRVAASFLRLGVVARFISEPVLTGFEAGVGLVIVVDQGVAEAPRYPFPKGVIPSGQRWPLIDSA